MNKLRLLIFLFLLIPSFIFGGNLNTSNEVTESQIDELKIRLSELVENPYKLEVKINEMNPYYWQSTDNYKGVTFYFVGQESFNKREGKKYPSIYLTFMPNLYDGRAKRFGGDNQIVEFPAKYLGKWKNLKIYGCRDFGYSLPKEGKFSEKNIIKTLKIKR